MHGKTFIYIYIYIYICIYSTAYCYIGNISPAINLLTIAWHIVHVTQRSSFSMITSGISIYFWYLIQINSTKYDRTRLWSAGGVINPQFLFIFSNVALLYV